MIAAPVRSFALLGLFACLAVVGSSAAGAAGLKPVTGQLKVKVGIADQKASVFEDQRLRGLNLGYARRSVAWDVLRFPGPAADLDAWIAGARSMGAEVLVTFARSSGNKGRKPPTPTAYLKAFRGFRARYPAVKAYAAWNEANHCGTGTCKKPELVAKYFNAIRRNCSGCKVVAADLLDQPNMVSWARRFRRAARYEPKYWGLHGYIDANRFQTTRTSRLLHAVKGEVWLTEVGGLVARRNGSTIKLRQGKAHAASATRYIFDRLARLSRRVTRIYLYHWRSSERDDSWDSAFIGADDAERPALGVLKRVLRQIRE